MLDALGGPSALNFLYRDQTGSLFRPTRLWIVADKGTAGGWNVSLVPPVGGESAQVIDDLKSWMLFDPWAKRVFMLGEGVERTSVSCDRDMVFRLYLRKVLASLPEEKRKGPFTILMPSVRDEERRRRYQDAIKAVVPAASILPEPEMVIEYFRLVRRDIKLERGRTGVFLVVDVGASTCNFTFVLTRKDGKVTESTEGRQRVERLRAVRGDAAQFAGRWADKEILEMLQLDVGALDRSVLSAVLDEVEAAKIKVSETGEPVAFNHAAAEKPVMVTPEHLVRLSSELWQNLAPMYSEVAVRFLDQIRGTAYAKEQFSYLLKEVEVRDGADVQHVIDAVLLAGGTTQLPGFEDAMRTAVFPNAKDLRVLRVGREFPVVAAVGAMAHVLNQYYESSLLQYPDGEPSGLESAQLIGALPRDICLEMKDNRGSKVASVVALARDEPFADTGGKRRIENLPDMRTGSRYSARLFPGGVTGLDPAESKQERRGIKTAQLTVSNGPGQLFLEWNPDSSEAHVSSPNVRGANALFLGFARMRVDERSLQAKPQAVPPDSIGCAAVDDVVIDLGMSKTVVLSTNEGSFSKTDLLPDAHVWSRTGEIQSKTRPDLPQVPEPTVRSVPNEGKDKQPEEERVDEPSGAVPLVVPSKPATALETSSFSGRLLAALGENAARELVDVRGDMTMLLLALSVRRFVMLAGPPGSGKSSLVRMAASLLGANAETAYHEVAVQPYWQESHLPVEARRGFSSGEESAKAKVFLFDEFNLSRPENYLMPFFRELEDLEDTSPQAQIYACATLNIDESSRPPSPKIMDRCFLLEIDPPLNPIHGRLPAAPEKMAYTPLGRLPMNEYRGEAPSGGLWDQVAPVLDIVANCVSRLNLRQDLIPSRRAIQDIRAILALYERERIPPELLGDTQLIDRVISGRVLPRISGAAEQVEKLIDELHTYLDGTALIRSRRRIQLSKQQLPLGFASPWQ